MLPGALRRDLEASPLVQPCDDVQSKLLATSLALDPPASDSERNFVDQLGLTLLAAYAAAGAKREPHGEVAKAALYIEQHLAEYDCLQDAHRAAGVSRNTLISRFRAELGVTPARYLWRIRTERGIAMLHETGHSVAEIAYACGFRDQFHFSRLVKSLQGISPQVLRRQLWATQHGR